MRFQVVPAAYVLLRRVADGAEQVLLQLRSGTGYMDDHWAAAAAGHVEAGESVFEAAAREAAEELGIAIDPADLVPLCAMHRTVEPHGPVDERVDFFLECRRWTGTPRRVEAGKTADLRWFALDALPAPVVPHELQVIGALADGAVPPIVTHGF
ncbi:DNA mismatch repair protein MutT [Blastococcus sp. TBT05-19]|uniref:NUDIX domain-containing protein n=1 Tax=Blastococcus sp. TBT05-19 TaxID=2250581 RepID=UPI000DE98D3C|nr:NUDIX domain-containing protein [Blastococcus sp. TBT05-19]RBY88898.1 DNA mismatch repair protein MutT [Blastococcus sp. TBT05-19]